ncbi:cell division protein ZapE [Nocardia amikacinitolerans]|uniref:cell division protein ZapE n=1 Tax=Nocardia amikacinitolerans TaxID=756689 RepID=UPI0027E28176|nr:cell division protein ZapE [Nocardia amikacinitolerans]MCP2293086.1 cell division protein ZapE [Nocardia amikacinitolerans]
MTIELDRDQRAAAERLARLVDRRGRPIKGARGVYLHGRPGRGKTMLMDRFLATADADRAKRYHFHWFFAELHSAAYETGSIDTAIERLLGTARLVCFDEFHVHDIGDAMLVARMLDALFARRIALVLTSNYPPAQLLPNPLFHDRFLPTIARVVEHLDVLSVDGPTDYRTLPNRDTTRGFAAGRYLVCCVPTESKVGTPPAPAASPARTVTAAGPKVPAEDELSFPTGDRRFTHTVDGDAIAIPTHGRALQGGAADGDAVDVRIGGRALRARAFDGDPVDVPTGGRILLAHAVDDDAIPIPIGDRTLRARAVDGDAITFDFSALCGTPTSAADYVGLTRHFRRWTIRNVPRLREVPPDWAMRLVNLVDVLYDADLELTLCAAAPLPELVGGVVGVPDISRTASRLCEISQAVTAAAG